MSNPLRLQFQQSLHCHEPLEYSLGVIEPVDADADRVLRRQSEALAYFPPAVLHGLADQIGRSRPLDRYRIPLDRSGFPAVEDVERFPIDPGFKSAFHRVDEIVS